MTDPHRKYGPWALVTGASSGIGAEFCRQLSALGFNIVFAARREERLKQLSNELQKKHKIETKVIVADLSEPGFCAEIKTETSHLDIGLLVNNAGFALTGNFLDHSVDEEIKLLQVNCVAQLALAHHFGNKMVEKGRGGIINVSSASSFLPMPGWANYAASKAYLTSFSQALWYELKGKNVDVQALCPAGVRTEFSIASGTKDSGMDVSVVVKEALAKLGKKHTVVPGFGTRIGLVMLRFLSSKISTKLGATAVNNMKKG